MRSACDRIPLIHWGSRSDVTGRYIQRNFAQGGNRDGTRKQGLNFSRRKRTVVDTHIINTAVKASR